MLADLVDAGSLRTTVRPDFLRGHLWEAVRPAGVLPLPASHHVLDLDRGFAQLWDKRFAAPVRTAVRKAERLGVEIESDATGRLVSEFYGLYESWTDRRADENGFPRPVARWQARRSEPLARLHVLAGLLGQRFRVWVARVDGRVAASIITLVQGENCLYWRGTSDKDLAGPSRANTLLQSRAVEYAISQGCRYYNMGESGGVASLERFKRGFGARPVEFAGCRIESLPLTALERRLEALKKRAEHEVSRLRGAA